MFRWLLNGCYVLLLIAVSPVIAWRMLRGKYRTGWSQKLLGRLPERPPGRERVWFHAVSVGEVLQLRTIIAGLLERRPATEVVITTTTTTGYDVAQRTFPDHTVAYFPLDFSWAVENAIARVRPTAIVLVELELWPNFVFAAQRARTPVGLINGRMGERSHRGYGRIRPLMRRLLSVFNVIAVQTETDADRIRDLGAPPHHVRVTGSVKFDHLVTDREHPPAVELRQAFGFDEDDIVFVAGSTQAPEERTALAVYEALRAEFPRLRLVLVPRHAERFEEVARLVAARGHAVARRSRPEQPADDESVRLLDTLGELGACWGLATIAFVGGSLGVRRGGQNMMEPAAYGAAVAFGPNTWNFANVVAGLIDREAARVVHDEDELKAVLRSWLADPRSATAIGERAREFVLAQRGATDRTLNAIESVLDAARPSGFRRAA